MLDPSKILFLILLIRISVVCTNAVAQKLPSTIAKQLHSPYFEKLYAHTYYSLLDRMNKDGYLPESLTGAYEGIAER